jgi:PAS domain-containing protein
MLRGQPPLGRSKADGPDRRGRGGARLVALTFGVAFVGAALAGAGVAAMAGSAWQREEARRLEHAALQLLRANVDVTAFPTVPETIRIGERLMATSFVRGGIVHNALGDEVGSFGQRPLLTVLTARREGVTSLASPDRSHVDVLYPAEASGLAHPVVLRLDASAVAAAVAARLRDAAVAIAAAALACAAFVAALLFLLVVKPVLRLRDAAAAATDRPDRADEARIGSTRRDELGEASRALDLLLTSVSLVHQEDLAAHDETTRRSTSAVLAFEPGGRLLTANPAALTLFGAATVDDLARGSGAWIRLPESGDRVSPLDLLARGEASRMVEIETPRGMRRCNFDGATIRRRSGSVLRHVVTLLDLTRHLAYADSLDAECAKLSRQLEEDQRRLAEMRGLFESCLVILSHARGADVVPEPAPVADDAPVVVTERIVNAWYAQACRTGTAQARLEHGVLPNLRGEASDVALVFRQALLHVASRARVVRPAVAVEARRDGAMAIFEVREVAGSEASEPRGPSDPTGGPVAQLGLALALARCGGHLVSRVDGPELRFALPAADPPRQPQPRQRDPASEAA